MDTLIIAMFVAYLYQIGYSYSTILSNISALSFMYKVLSVRDNTKDGLIQKVLQGVKNLSMPSNSLLPIGCYLLDQILNRMDRLLINHYDKCLYKSIFLWLYYACLRVSEVASSGYNNSHAIQSNNVVLYMKENRIVSVIINMFSYKFSKGKTVKLLLSRVKGKQYCPVHAFEEYMKIRPKVSGNLFVQSSGIKISRAQIVEILQFCLQSLNLNTCRYNTHSFRIGRATDLALRGVSTEQIRMIGRWASDAYLKYVRPSLINCVPHDDC